MRYNEVAWSDALRRAQWYWEQNATALGVITAGRARTRLDETIAGIEAAAAAQERAERQQLSRTESVENLRTKLRTQNLQLLSAIAQEHRIDIPSNVMSQFTVPEATASDGKLLASARAMAAAAADNRQVFLDENLPETFVDDLRQVIADLQAELVARDGEGLTHRAAVEVVKHHVRGARDVIRILSGHVVRTFAGQPEKITEWQGAIRVRTKPGVPRGRKADAAAVPAAPETAGNVPVTTTPVADGSSAPDTPQTTEGSAA